MKQKNNIKENQQMRTKLMRLVAGAILATLFLPVGAENENGDNLPAGNEQKRGVNYSPNLLTASRSKTLGDDIDRYPGGFDFSITLGKKHRHRRKGTTELSMGGVGLGFVSALGEPAPMDVSMGRSLEINWTEALALLYKEAIEKALPRGTSQVVLAISRLATLMGHDKDWQETLSRHV